MITEIEQPTLDIDWFFTNNEEIAFLASGGGKLPSSVAKSSENLKVLSSFFEDLTEKSDIILNPNLNKRIGNSDEMYLDSFLSMAKKGLFSYDRTILNNFSDTNYHLVAQPVSPLKIHELPQEIAEMLMEIKYSGSMEATLDIASLL